MSDPPTRARNAIFVQTLYAMMESFRDDGKPSTKYVKWLHETRDNESSTNEDGERVSTDQYYREKLSSHPPDSNLDPVVYSLNKDKEEADVDPESAEDTQLMYVVLTDENSMPRLYDDDQPITTHGIAPDELQGRTFLQPQPDGTIRCDRITKEVQDLECQSSHFASSPEMINFKVSFDKEDVEDVIADVIANVIAYNVIMNYISRKANEEDGELWKF